MFPQFVVVEMMYHLCATFHSNNCGPRFNALIVDLLSAVPQSWVQKFVEKEQRSLCAFMEKGKITEKWKQTEEPMESRRTVRSTMASSECAVWWQNANAEKEKSRHLVD